LDSGYKKAASPPVFFERARGVSSCDPGLLPYTRIQRTHDNDPSPRRDYAKESKSKAEPERAAVVHWCPLVLGSRLERGRNGYSSGYATVKRAAGSGWHWPSAASAEPEEPGPAVFDVDAIDWRSRVPEEDRGTRYDSPWYWLTDAELSAAVAAAGGRASIGFKDPNEPGGVDEEGRVIGSPAPQAAGKQFLRALGLAFELEFVLAPAVTLIVPVELVPVIRSNPLIDYIEPVLPGVRAG